MIVTVTPNPSIDRSIALASLLRRGEVVRSRGSVDEPGGKGINVAQVVHRAGARALALLPAESDDDVVRALRQAGLPHRAVGGGRSRINLTLTEDDGTTTKINASGPPLAESTRERLEQALADAGAEASWIALCGSLPPGAPADWYGRLAAQAGAPRVAVDASGPPLRAAVDSAADRIALIKPNAQELGELLDVPADSLADPRQAWQLSRPLLQRGIGQILLTLGAAGALLINTGGVWQAPAPRVVARSTVGAGDSSLAGFLLASMRGEDPARCLALAVAYGSAAASLPGTRLPGPADLPQRPHVHKVC